jgi:hypothetical protein
MHVVVENRQAPGDLLVLTAAVRALHTAFPGEFTTEIASTCPDVQLNNPYCTKNEENGQIQTLYCNMDLGRRTLHANNSNAHYVTSMLNTIGRVVKRDIPLADMRPHVVLAPNEKPPADLVPYSYWVVMAGGKSDLPAKLWGFDRWQSVIDATPDIKWVQAGSVGVNTVQKQLKNVKSLVGTTTFREFLRLIAFSRGVVCHVTSGMHAAAAFNRPCVVVAGGREPFWWEAYNDYTWATNCGNKPPPSFMPHAYLHSIGTMPCCRVGGCWYKGTGSNPTSNCICPTSSVDRVPRCLSNIAPDHVISEILAYERGEKPTSRGTSEAVKLLE